MNLQLNLTHISKKLKEEGIIKVQNFFSNEIISELSQIADNCMNASRDWINSSKNDNQYFDKTLNCTHTGSLDSYKKYGRIRSSFYKRTTLCNTHPKQKI